MPLLLILFLSLFSASSDTATWQCSNNMEIRCDSESCKAEKEGEFTPMSVTFDEKGEMSVCAYSGCWEGTGDVFTKGDFMVWTGNGLKFSTAPDLPGMNENISITLDKTDNIATLKAGAFAHPLVCEMKSKD